jgi:hypothetical protein
MVVVRTIENLRQRPAEDRRAVASSIAIGVAVLILVIWTFVFIRSLRTLAVTSQQEEAYTAAVGAVDSITVSVNPEN